MVSAGTSAAFVAIVAFLLAAGAPGALSLHEDQLGRFDWYQQYLGSFTSGIFSKTRGKLAVSTSRNALSVLNLRTGEVEWRHVFGESDPLHQLALTEKPAALFSLSGDGSSAIVRAWNQHTGAMVWDMPVCDPDARGAGAGTLASMGADQAPQLSKALVFVSGCGEVKAINTSTADVAWTYALAHGADSVELTPHPMSASLTVVATYGERSSSPGVEVSVLSVLDGQRLRGVRVPGPAAGGAVKASVARGKVVVLQSGGSEICEADVTEGAELSCVPLSQVVPGLEEGATADFSATQPLNSALLESRRGGAVSGHIVLDPSQGGLSSPRVKLFDEFAVACALNLDDGGEVIGMIGSKAEAVWWTVVDAATGAVIHEEEVKELHKWGRGAAGGAGTTQLERCFLGSFSRKDGTTGWRMLAASSDSSVALLQQSEVVWVREESLSGVTVSLAVDFPKTSGGLEGQTGLSTMQHLRKQILTLKFQMGASSPEERAELNELRHAGSDTLLTTPDSAGFRKLLLVLSESGKLLALHNGDGHVVWGLAYDPVCPPQELHMWQEPHSVTVSPKVVVMRASSSACPGMVSVVDAHTGKELESPAAQGPGSQILPLPCSFRTGKAEQQMFLLVSHGEPGSSSSPTATLLPSSQEAAAAFAPYASLTKFWDLQDGPVPGMKGFALASSSEGATAFEAVEVWSVRFSAHEKILTAVQPSSGSVHTRIKVLGDRSMLVKYLNPNTVFVATSSGSAFGAGGNEVTVHIIDTVTGRHLFRQRHESASGPVAAVFCENWIVYHYFSDFHMRHEVAVIELYDDSSARGLSLPDAIMSNTSTAISSSDPVAIKALRQVFFFNHAVKFMGVTTTSQGITAKQVLIGTSGNQIYALDKRFVDPRRPLGKPTKEDQEERLMPYKPDLGIHPPFFVTYDKTVAGLRGVNTFPTALESTSLMFAFGMDIFYTRLAPSKSFDMLDDDFSYALLVITLLGMAGLAVYLMITKQRNELAKKWA